MSNRSTLTAREAAIQLGISRATLYAYVSRGLIRSEPGPGGARERRYSLADVVDLKQRQTQRRDPTRAAEGALNWGTPVLESAITLIENGHLYYRGNDAIEAARSRSFEEIVGLLWFGRFDIAWLPADVTDNHVISGAWQADLSPLERCQLLLPLLAQSDPAAYDLRPRALLRAGNRILSSMASVVAGAPIEGGIAKTLANHWALGVDCAEQLINTALNISADHELNSSSFTVRCVASAGAPLYDAIMAGICAIRGVRHGAASHRIEAMLAEVGHSTRALLVLEDRLRRGECIPGFGHNLYPAGDPRGKLLIDMCRELMPSDPALELTEAVMDAAAELIQERPNLDYGLVTVSRALRLTAGSAMTLMALGRVAGWVAHALEQYPLERMIRPRARYVGRPAMLETRST